MSPRIAQMAESSPNPSNSRGLDARNRIEFEEVSHYGEFAAIGQEGF